MQTLYVANNKNIAGAILHIKILYCKILSVQQLKILYLDGETAKV